MPNLMRDETRYSRQLGLDEPADMPCFASPDYGLGEPEGSFQVIVKTASAHGLAGTASIAALLSKKKYTEDNVMSTPSIVPPLDGASLICIL